MSINNLFKQESDCVTEQAIKIPFSFDDTTSLPKGKNVGDCIVIKPIKVSTWFKIRPFLLQIEQEDLDKMVQKPGEMNVNFVGLMDKYGDMLIDIILLGIHNKPSEPPAWFRKVLVDNCTWEDIRILLNAVLYRIGYFPFCNAITTLKNVSPIGEQEIIAARKNLESWSVAAKQDF